MSNPNAPKVDISDLEDKDKPNNDDELEVSEPAQSMIDTLPTSERGAYDYQKRNIMAGHYHDSVSEVFQDPEARMIAAQEGGILDPEDTPAAEESPKVKSGKLLN